MKKYKVIIFDFDETLVQTKDVRYEAAKYTAKEFYGLDISNSTIDKYWGLPFRDLIKALFKDIDTFENIANNYKSIIHLFALRPFDDAFDTLQKLNKDYILGIVSSSTQTLIDSGLKDVGLPKNFFKYIQASENSIAHKPDGAVFDPLKDFLKGLNIKNSEVIYVGDSLDDFIAANNADIDFLGIARSEKRIEEFTLNKANFVKSLSEILDDKNFI